MSSKFQIVSPQTEIPMKYIEKEGLANKNLRKRSLAYKKFMYFWQSVLLFPPTLRALRLFKYVSYTFHCLCPLFLFPDHFLSPVAFAQLSLFPREAALSPCISCQAGYCAAFRWQLYQWLARSSISEPAGLKQFHCSLLKALFSSVRDPYTWVQYQLHTYCVFTNILCV